MAETVLSMARSVVGSAISKAASAAADETSLLLGVEKDIWYIKDELKTMHAFLRAAEVMKKKDDLLKVWAERIRDLSYDIEDSLDEFKVHIESQTLFRQLLKLRERHWIAIRIHNLKSRVEEVSSRNTRYNLVKHISSIIEDDTEPCAEDIRNQLVHNVDETELVGFSDSKERLLDMIDANANDGPTKGLQGKVVVQVHHLSEFLVKELKDKRYFVVLDDLWSLDAWNWINGIAFPKNNMKGSRIIITTRNVGLADTIASRVYHLELLQMNDAITLLLRKTNKKHEDMESNKNMQKIVERIVNKCGRLPLAILTIGAVLATKHVSDWEKFYEQLPSELENNPSLDALRRMVTLGYNHLPSHLKPCFLYLSIFPEDFEIQRNRLVNRWIAEGFVRAKVGMATKDVGEMHGNTRHIAFHGTKSCKIGFDWSIIRSLAIFGDGPKNLAHTVCLDQLRMLRVLDLENVVFLITQKDFNNIVLLRHLKYLSIGRSSCIYSLPRSIGKLQGLQTLNMPSTYMATLPTEISELQCLHTLRCIREYVYDSFNLNQPLKCLTNAICMPKIFTPLVNRDDRAKQIAELHMATKSCWSESSGVKVPKGIGKLGDLQILEHVDIRRTSSTAINELGQLSKLRKLSVTTARCTKEKYKIFYAAIQKLFSLQSLCVDAVENSDSGTLECLDSVSSPLLLRTIGLYGYLEELPEWIEQLTHLVKLYLLNNKLKESKTMMILGTLPNLTLLYLYVHAYTGVKLVFETGAFPNLRTLFIQRQDQLRELRFEDDSSPRLEKLEISRCRLESGIIGIIHLPRLKEISLDYGTKVARLGQLEGEVAAHPNRPVLRMGDDRSEHDLGNEAEGSAIEVEATEPLPEQEGESSQVISLTTNDRRTEIKFIALLRGTRDHESDA
uniref:NB-ARC domain-containing protein n=1 Tax=Leersia perrieri TaxID=77586 RepID=A0A0D9WPD8_9ORYZ